MPKPGQGNTIRLNKVWKMVDKVQCTTIRTNMTNSILQQAVSRAPVMLDTRGLFYTSTLWWCSLRICPLASSYIAMTLVSLVIGNLATGRWHNHAWPIVVTYYILFMEICDWKYSQCMNLQSSSSIVPHCQSWFVCMPREESLFNKGRKPHDWDSVLAGTFTD